MWSVYWPQRNVRDTGKSFFLSFFLSIFLSFFLCHCRFSILSPFLQLSLSLLYIIQPRPPHPSPPPPRREQKAIPSIYGRVSRNSCLSSAISTSLEEKHYGCISNRKCWTAITLHVFWFLTFSKASQTEPRTYLQWVSTANLQQNICNDLCISTF